MTFNIKRNLLFPGILMLLALVQPAIGQENDSLSLNTIIQEVILNHPSVQKAMEEVSVADDRIGFAKSGNLPTAEFSTSYSRLGPTIELTIPNMGTFSMMSPNNYSAAINVNQTIYDFGKTAENISVEKEGKELASKSIDAVKQKLSQSVVAGYFSLLYLQEAIKIKNEELNNLNEHLQYIKKKQETGSATQYEILTTQVRISAIESSKTDLETVRKVQICQLNSLMGKPDSNPIVVKKELLLQLPQKSKDALISDAMQNRDEMKIANEKSKLAEMKYHLVHAQNNPVLNAFASGGVKNGYFPSLDAPKMNYVIGVGFKMPIYDGKRLKYNLLQTESAIHSNDMETEITRRGIVNEVVEAKANLEASQEKVNQFLIQLQQAKQAYDLAKIRFNSGALTNIELLDGSTAISESELFLLKSQIDFTVSGYKLKMAIGDRLY
jgi:outer membrane protein